METKERILAAAKELFFKFGIKSVTMDDIARHLGMSKKTIYQFFRDKDEIVMDLCRQDLDNHDRKLVSIVENSSDAILEILQIMEYVEEFFHSINPTMLYDLQKFYPNAWNLWKAFKETRVMELVQKNFKTGISQGLYRTDLNGKILAKLRIEQIEMAMNPQIFPPVQFDLPQVQVVILDHFLYGILTLKGHKLINKYKQIEEAE